MSNRHADQFTVAELIPHLTSKIPFVHFKADSAALLPSSGTEDVTPVCTLPVGLSSGTIQCCLWWRVKV